MSATPLSPKASFVLSLYEQLVGGGQVSAKKNPFWAAAPSSSTSPTSATATRARRRRCGDFYRLLKLQPEPEAQGLALASELFNTGTLNTFAKYTNVDTQARIIDYDIRELGEQLMRWGCW